MDLNLKTNALCLRYVVPFRLTDSMDYETAVKRINSAALESDGDSADQADQTRGAKWTEVTPNIGISESDLYEYIRNELRDSKHFRTGKEWIWSENVKPVKGREDVMKLEAFNIRDFCYVPDGLKGEKTRTINLTISYAGIQLYKNGHGIFWFEIADARGRKTAFADSGELVLFQNRVRELNRSRNTWIWEKGNLKTGQEQESEQKQERFGYVIKRKKLGEKGCSVDYITPFFLGCWIQQQLACLEGGYQFFAYRKASYKDWFANYVMAAKKADAASGAEQSLVLNENKTYEGPAFKYAPDKPILFSYYGFLDERNSEECRSEEPEDIRRLTYYLTNGYKESYHFSSQVGMDMLHPFGDSLWFATKEGAAYVSWASQDNKETYGNIIPMKYRTDYFRLFTKVLYQSFSLLLYAERIQCEIPSDPGEKDYKWTEADRKRVQHLFEEISLFQAKSMATTVSYIHHQSEFFIYLKKQLHVHEDVKSVTSGLDAVNALLQAAHREEKEENDKKEQQEWRLAEAREKKSDNKLQAIMGLLAFLGIGSAFVDWFDFLWDVTDIKRWGEISTVRIVIEGIALAGILLVSVYAAIFCIKAFREARKEEKEERRKEKGKK